jgi:hypothetical protein
MIGAYWYWSFFCSESFLADLKDSSLGDVNGNITPTWYAVAFDVSPAIVFFPDK